MTDKCTEPSSDGYTIEEIKNLINNYNKTRHLNIGRIVLDISTTYQTNKIGISWVFDFFARLKRFTPVMLFHGNFIENDLTTLLSSSDNISGASKRIISKYETLYWSEKRVKNTPVMLTIDLNVKNETESIKCHSNGQEITDPIFFPDTNLCEFKVGYPIVSWKEYEITQLTNMAAYTPTSNSVVFDMFIHPDLNTVLFLNHLYTSQKNFDGMKLLIMTLKGNKCESDEKPYEYYSPEMKKSELNRKCRSKICTIEKVMTEIFHKKGKIDKNLKDAKVLSIQPVEKRV